MPNYAWTHYAAVAAHHGAVVGASVLAGCAVSRFVQSRIGARLPLEEPVALPPPGYFGWGLASFALGTVGAGLHWLVYPNGHGGWDGTVNWLLAVAGAGLVLSSLDLLYTRHRVFLAFLAVGALVGVLVIPDAWRHPNSVDWFGQYELLYLIFVSYLIVFPVPAPPGRRPRRPRPPRPGRVTPAEGGEPPKDSPGTSRIKPKVNRIRPR